MVRNAANLGIAAALNLGIRQALETGVEWIALFDQDSSVTPDYFSGLLQVYALCPGAKSMGMVVPRGWSAAMARILRLADPVWRYALAANTSGSLVKREVFERVGYHDEDLFIDCVDTDFCLRLHQHGFTILKAMGVVLNHELGSPQTRHFLGFKIFYRDHTPWRYYYMTRNRLLIYERYFDVAPKWILTDLPWFCHFVAQLFLEHDRRKKLIAIFIGVRDALSGRTGRHPLFPPPAK
jgi:rhamnosyltransferase